MKRAALKLLAKGLVTQSEAARLADVSRQLMRHWASEIDCEGARDEHLAQLWARVTKRPRR